MSIWKNHEHSQNRLIIPTNQNFNSNQTRYKWKCHKRAKYKIITPIIWTLNKYGDRCKKKIDNIYIYILGFPYWIHFESPRFSRTWNGKPWKGFASTSPKKFANFDCKSCIKITVQNNYIWYFYLFGNPLHNFILKCQAP